MKSLGNVAKHLDLNKPVTQEQLERALVKARKDSRPLQMKDALKAGYRIDPLRPTVIAMTCAALMGRRITVIPKLVRD